MPTEIPDWNGAPLPVARSLSGKAIAVCDVDRNLIRGSATPWPSPEVLQKLCAADRLRSFSPEDHAALTRKLGFYCDLQSLSSEDAMTWSYFGPVVNANADVRNRFGSWLLSRIGIKEQSGNCNIWLWRRVVHPDKPISLGGPEIDFAVQCGSALILGEAKWKSSVGRNQGANSDKDQIQLRREFCGNFGPRLFPGVSIFVVLALGVTSDIAAELETTLTDRRFLIRNLKWEELCSYCDHPLGQEIGRYYRWKYQWTFSRR